MHLHKVRNRPLTTLKGIGVVLGLVGVILLDSLITGLLIPWTGELVCAILFWGIGILVALWTMRRYVLTYSYGLGPNLLRVAFAYGRWERVMSDIYFNNILNAGSLEEMKKRYPGARVTRADLPHCDIEPMTIACTDGGKPALFVLQPDEVIREKLVEVAKKNRK